MRPTDSFHRILVGVDARGLAVDAVRQARLLARRLGAELHLVQAVQHPTPWHEVGGDELEAMRASALERERKEMLAHLSRALSEAGEDAADLDALATVHEGHPAEVILGQADERLSDLLVLGPHAKRSIFDFGSTTRAVLSHTSVPVWSQPGPPRPVRRMLVAVDLSRHSQSALAHAHELAGRLGASLRVLHCRSEAERAAAADAFPGPRHDESGAHDLVREQLLGWLDELGRDDVEVEPLLVDGEPEPTIVREGSETDLVVLGTHGRTGLSRVLLGSVAYDVLKHCDVPVLVVPSPKRNWLLAGTGAAPWARD